MKRNPAARTVRADDGLTMNLVDFGGATSPPLLLLHGAFGHARVWDFVVEGLPDDQQASALDLPGHGLSEHADDPGRYRFERLVPDLARVVASLAAPPVLAGHSLGGGLAMTYAARYPATLAGAVFMDVEPYPLEAHTQSMRDAGGRPPREYDDFDRVISWQARGAPNAASAVHEHLARHGFMLEDGTWRQRFDQRFLATLERWDAREGLREISVPVLAMRGADSGVMTDEIIDFMRERLPVGHAAVIPGAGHQLHLEQPGRVAGALADFLARVR